MVSRLKINERPVRGLFETKLPKMGGATPARSIGTQQKKGKGEGCCHRAINRLIMIDSFDLIAINTDGPDP